MNIKYFCIIAGTMAILAILPWPYAYYQLLRWVIFISAAIIAYGFNKSKLLGWALAFGVIAFLFNPLFPIYLNRSTWSGIDLVTGIIFFMAAYSKKK